MLPYAALVASLSSWESAHPELMHAYDSVNALMEIVSVFMLVPTIVQASRTKLIVGVHWLTPTFYMLWSYWNTVFWYPHLGQFWSWIGSALIAVGNTVWVYMVIRYTPSGQFAFRKLKPLHVEGNT